MSSAKSAYELRRSQVKTPPAVIALLWQIVRKHRTALGRVLDLGAGDARFSVGGLYEEYEGVEIDPDASTEISLPSNGRITVGCAFKHLGSDYSACIGNPPYLRHHDLELPWKRAAAKRIENDLLISFDKHGNLYLYFLCLALTKSATDGLLALVIPYEWVSRPSAGAIRHYIRKRRWSVSVYRFQHAIFAKVLTTASITIIDKASRSGLWRFYDVQSDLTITERHGAAGGRHGLLPYSSRGEIWARRGLSPGSQEVFTLTEDERINAGLRREDVVPCVTTLRNVPETLKELNWMSFQKHFVAADRKCWLIRCRQKRVNRRIRAYLEGIPVEFRTTYTCLNQKPWYSYEWMPIPRLLFHSAFTSFGPKVVVNSLGAQAVGSVYGVCSDGIMSARRLQSYLLNFEFESRVVAHAKQLKKVEVRQLNAVLKRFAASRSTHGKVAR